MAAIVAPSDLRDGELRLRAPTADDVAGITAVCQDPAIQRFTRVPSPYGEADARRFVLMTIGASAEGRGLHLLIVPDDDDADRTVLGCVGVGIDPLDRTGELGYWVAADARGRGVATRAAWLLARHVFDHLDVVALTLRALVTNPASNSVARRLGFREVGVLRRAMTDGPTGDPTAARADARVYDLLPGELRDPGAGGA